MIKLLVTVVICFFGLLFVILLTQKESESKGILQTIKDRLVYIEQNRILKVICIMFFFLIPILFLFWNYLVGNQYWIFTNFASDSYGQTYPQYLIYAERISSGNNINGWNFFQGLGDNIGKCILTLTSWVCFFGKTAVKYLMGISYILDILISGFIFFLYLKTLQRGNFASLIGALGYAFCGHIIIRGRWTVMPAETVCVAVLLLTFELVYRGKHWIWLSLGIVFLYFNIGSGYYMVLYLTILFAYTIFRCFTEKIHSPIKFFKKILYSIILVLPIIAGFLSDVSSSIHSDRLQSGVEQLQNTGSALKIFSSLDTLQTAFFRTIGIDILGNGEAYSGVGDILVDPTFYCGLLIVLMVPFAFVCISRTKKIWYCLALMAILIYICIIPVRALSNGFSGDYFKLSSFWIIVLLIFWGTEGIDKIFANGKDKKKYLFILWGNYFLVFSLTIFFTFLNKEIIISKLLISHIFLVIYCVVITFKVIKPSGLFLAKGILLLLGMAETCLLSFNYINTEESLTESMIQERYGYDDYSTNALDYLRNVEGSLEDFRIGKTYSSFLYGDSLAQEYMGFKSYVGGLGNRADVVNFYELLNLPKRRIDGKYLEDPLVSNELNTLLGTKYILSKEDSIGNYGYSILDGIESGDVKVYINDHYLPLAFVYDSYISRADFEELDTEERRSILLETGVVDEDGLLPEALKYTADETDYNLVDSYFEEYTVSAVGNANMYEFSSNTVDQTILVKVNYNKKGITDDTRSFLRYYSNNEEKGYIQGNVPIGNSSELYEINTPDISQILIDTRSEDIEVQNVQIAIVPKEKFHASYVENVTTLKQNALNNLKVDIDSATITGDIDIKTDGLLYVAIPYDDNWHIFVDGAEQEKIKTNIAFLGAYISEGEHEIKISYSENAFRYEIFIQIMGYIILVIAIIYVICKQKGISRKVKGKNG